MQTIMVVNRDDPRRAREADRALQHVTLAIEIDQFGDITRCIKDRLFSRVIVEKEPGLRIALAVLDSETNLVVVQEPLFSIIIWFREHDKELAKSTKEQILEAMNRKGDSYDKQ